jgi:drug/metabolite transporter (DMT)-like permease
MTWFLFAMIAILFWSGSDLFSKLGSPPEDTESHWKMVMFVGAVMGAHAVSQLALGVPFSVSDMLVYLPASALYILSMILGYAGLRYIELSISSPICNSSGAVAAVLCFVFLGETMTGLQFVGVALVCIGVFLLSYLECKQDDALRAAEGLPPRAERKQSVLALLFPLLYCAIDGLGTFADALLLDTVIGEVQANIAYELTFLCMAVVAFVYVVCIKKQKIVFTREKPKMLASLCETAGQFAYVFAIGSNAIVAAPLISSYCIVSLLWSRILLKERLTRAQYGVIALAAVGIVILGME